MTILYLYIVFSIISAALVVAAGMHSSRINQRNARVEVYNTPRHNKASKFAPQSIK